MKRPSKALKTLLWVRELKEQQAEQRFQQAQQALLDLENMLKEVSARPKKIFDEISGKVLSGEEIKAVYQHVEKLLAEKEEVEKILERKRKELENLRRETIKAHQHRQIAERLWERAQKAFLRELLAEETKTVEDIIIMRGRGDENA
ncbi:flagellar export protein FliJ [Thermodesulfatator atlanticus]|uniref:flagellar FliJ family protein n=1 Tax=Thermodesulfatator atlanticus TaxID=501497 RepID=UPI0003B33B41|nr:flagellar FliJ family protein [Thermodesulfatator atlanticus]